MIDTLLRDLRQPEYIHVLINPLPIYGLAMAWIGLIIALILRSRRAQITALAIVLISAASAWPVFEFGEQGYDPVLSMSDENGQAWLEAHKDRAETLIYYFYALAVLSAAAIAVPIKWPKSSLPFAIVVILFGAVVLGMGGYIAYAGGKIRHREFRNVPPPKPSLRKSSAFRSTTLIRAICLFVVITELDRAEQNVEGHSAELKKRTRPARSGLDADRFCCRHELGRRRGQTRSLSPIHLAARHCALLHSAGRGRDLSESAHAARRRSVSMGEIGLQRFHRIHRGMESVAARHHRDGVERLGRNDESFLRHRRERRLDAGEQMVRLARQFCAGRRFGRGLHPRPVVRQMGPQRRRHHHARHLWRGDRAAVHRARARRIEGIQAACSRCARVVDVLAQHL